MGRESSFDESEKIPEDTKALVISGKGKNRKSKRDKTRHENRRRELSGEDPIPNKKVAPSSGGDKKAVNGLPEKESTKGDKRRRDSNANTVQGTTGEQHKSK